MIGEFEEQDFIQACFGARLPPDCYYWHEGMADWKPISEYRALAKTQRISFAPPMRRTMKIDMDSIGASDVQRQPARRSSGLARFWQRLTGRRGA